MDDQHRPENPFRVRTPAAPAAAPAAVPAVAPVAPVASPAPAPVKKPGKGGTVVLWLGAIVGVYMACVSVGDVRYSVVYALGGVLLGLAIALGFGWPLYCRRVDRKAVEAWEKDRSENRELSALLTEEDATIARALAPRPCPEPKPRNWKKVGTAVAVLAVLGSGLISAGDEAYKEDNPDALTSTQA